MNFLVSIIMPVYNGESYLSEAIESILRQTYTNFELIIINDGSKDNSKNIIKSYLEDSRLYYYEQKNAGVSAARNLALEKSQGDLIAFLDQDDLWHNNKLEVQVLYLKNHKNISLVYSDFIFLEGTSSNIKASDKFNHNLSKCDFKSLFIINSIGILTVVVYKSVIISSGGFNENLAGTDDYELWLKISLYHEIFYLNEALAIYRWHNDNVSKDTLKMTINEIKCLEGLLQSQPSAIKRLDEVTINNRLYPLHKKAGDLFTNLNNGLKGARSYYIRSLKYSQVRSHIIRDVIFTFVPRKIKSYIKWRYNKSTIFFSKKR